MHINNNHIPYFLLNQTTNKLSWHLFIKSYNNSVNQKKIKNYETSYFYVSRRKNPRDRNHTWFDCVNNIRGDIFQNMVYVYFENNISPLWYWHYCTISDSNSDNCCHYQKKKLVFITTLSHLEKAFFFNFNYRY